MPSRKSGLKRLVVGIVWVPLQIILLPLIYFLLLLAAVVTLSYQLAVGSIDQPRASVWLIVTSENLEGWNRRNLTYVFTGMKRFQLGWWQ